MSWHRYLQLKTRDATFLWYWGIGILLVGAAVAWLAQWLPRPSPSPDSPAKDAYNAHLQGIQLFAQQGEWGELALGIPRLMYLGWLPGPTSVALLAGFCWLVFLLQAGQPGARDGVRPWLCLLGVPLGVLSIWPTSFANFWQEHAWGLVRSEELAAGLMYFVLSVGLREELAKLLMFLPLVPFVVRRGSEREALLVAASVGLGFAIEENIGYFLREPHETVGRFLSANFLHMSLTGLCGLALCRAIWHPRRMASESLGIILLMIIAHGLYDALIVLPGLFQLSIASFVIYLLLVYQFFRELRTWWKPRGAAISLTATVVTSTTLVVAATLVYLAAQFDFDLAIRLVGPPAIGSAMFLYVYLREVPETLTDA